MLIGKSLLLLILIVVFAAAFWGLGASFLQNRLASMQILTGMSVYLFYAGILNLVGLGFLPLLLIPLLFGLYRTLLLSKAYLSTPGCGRQLVSEYRDTGILLTLLWGLCAVSVAFPDAYNFHDDYQKYFIQPTKLLATGSLYGSPLSTVGKETFGGQAAFQALFIGFGGIRSINAFDAVFCFLLSAFLLTDLGRELGDKVLALLAVVLLAVINPQYVNVSALYSFACFALGAVIVHQQILRRESAELPNSAAILMGMFYATALALKTTYALLALTHFPLVVMTLLVRGHPIGKVLKWSVLATCAGVVTIVPWLLKPLIMVLAADGGGLAGTGIPTSPDWSNLGVLASRQSIFYGGTPLAYAGMLLACAALLGISLARRSRQDSLGSGVAALVSATLVLCYAVAFIGNQYHMFTTAFRYAVPFLVALAPAALLILGSTGQAPEPAQGGPERIWRLMSVVLSVLLISAWIPSRIDTLRQSQRCGSTLAFSEFACSQRYIDYNNYVLEGNAAERMRKLQELVPEGATIIAWVNYAHLLDFKRNKIVEIDLAGLSNGWARMPGAEYLVLDTTGFATRGKAQLQRLLQSPGDYDRKIWQAALDFISYLEQNVRVEAVLGQAQEIVLYKVAVPDNREFQSNIAENAVSKGDS